MNILLENFRCFAAKHTIKITPLTLLVGENSTGKSTLLAALSVIFDFSTYPSQPRFDMPPYNLGSYDTLATHLLKKIADTFSLGFEIKTDDKNKNFKVIANYSSDLGQASLSKFTIESNYGCIDLIYGSNNLHCQFSHFKALNGQNAEIDLNKDKLPPLKLESIEMLLAEIIGYSQEKICLLELLPPIMLISSLIESVSLGGINIAPIRSKPKRTYDYLTMPYDPEGDYIPYAIAHASQQNDHKLKQLNQFGKESGLFNDIRVNILRDKLGNPFQLHVKMPEMSAEMSVNLTDVGYGVSQSLPIIAQTILKTGSDWLLLQQPEVHLHPRAQAALGSFFVRQVSENNRRFVIETHSNYLLDRIRQEIALGVLMPDQVSILYFDKPGLETTIHQLSLDKNGNILDAPPSYFRFFLEEEMNLVMRGNRE